MKDNKSSTQPNLLKVILFGHLRTRLAILLFSLLSAIFGLASPLFQKIFVDGLMGFKESFSSTLIPASTFTDFSPSILVTFSFVALLLSTGASVLTVWTGAKEANRLQEYLGDLLYQKTLRMRADQLGNKPVGEIVALYATDVQGATLMLEEAIPWATSTAFPLMFAPLAVYLIAGIPVWATLFVTVLVVGFNLLLARRQSQFFYFFKHLAAQRVGLVSEWIQNIRLLRILGWTENFENKIKDKRIEETVNRIKMVTNGQFMSSVGSSISFFINLIGIGSLIFLSTHPLRPSDLLALLWIFGVFLSRPFRQIPWMFTMGLDGLTSIKRLQNFLSQPDEGDDQEETLQSAIRPAPASLEVKGLSLAIGSGSDQRHLLHDIHFSVAAGEWLAIVGEVGSGKTLLLLSLMGEAGASFEKFHVNGESVLAWPVDLRRRLFSFVPQEGFVMSATLRENVALEYEHGAENDPKILTSLNKAQFDIINEHIRGGLEAEIGERGVNLSGGQKQRVSLARAEYFSRPLLLLDDCLSAVDVETERLLVDELLNGAWRKRTRLLVTHRLSVLAHVDRILFLENGRVEAMGRFEELLRSNEKFRLFAETAKKEKSDV